MTDRPAILDSPEAFVVVPVEPTGRMVGLGILAYDGKCEKSYNAMLAARPDPTSMADVVRYVETLEAEAAFTISDASRLLRKEDVQGACPHPDDCFYETDRVRCGPCAVKASAAKGVVVDDTFSHLPEVCRLRREVKAAEARITALEAALVEAERALEDFVSTYRNFEDGNGDPCPQVASARTAIAKIKETRNAD